MLRFRLAIVIVLAACVPWTADVRADDAAVSSRHFEFHYGVTFKNLPIGEPIRIWWPIPPDNAHQTVKTIRTSYPGKVSEAEDPKYGNRIGYVATVVPESGQVSLFVAYDVVRREVRALTEGGNDTPIEPPELELFLAPNRRVPINGKPLQLLDKVTLSDDPVEVARQLYDRVDSHVRYDKSKPGYGRGDVLWVCDSQFGNCTDFHSLFISLARAKGIPARFEIGFPLPKNRGSGKISGYHCWGWFYSKHDGWIPVDISEADKHPEMKDYYFGNLTGDRVAFSTGRDIELVPRQEGPPLNFFIYPYAEIDGQPVSRDKTELDFRYRDIEEEQEPANDE